MNYIALFFVSVESSNLFSELNASLESFFYLEGENSQVEITQNGAVITLKVKQWSLQITANNDLWGEQQRFQFAMLSNDVKTQNIILNHRVRWDVVSQVDVDDQFYNYFQLTCDVVKSIEPEIVQYDPILGGFC